MPLDSLGRSSAAGADRVQQDHQGGEALLIHPQQWKDLCRNPPSFMNDLVLFVKDDTSCVVIFSRGQELQIFQQLIPLAKFPRIAPLVI